MISIGSDHGGYDLKMAVIAHLQQRGMECKDFGCYDKNSCDYPEFGRAAAEAVASGECEKGIVVCTTGIGISIAANKVKGAYAALVSDVYSAERARLSNDANIACMGAFTSGSKNREAMATAFLTNEFVKGCSSQPKIDVFIEYDKER